MKPRILVIDDETAIRDSVRMILEYEHYECISASSGPEGLTILKKDQPDMVVLDIKMPGMSGLEALSEIRKVDESVPVAMMSGHGTVADAMQATRLGAFDFIEKPFTSERVLVTVAKGLEVRQLKRENRELKLAMEARYEIVGDSPALRTVLDAVQEGRTHQRDRAPHWRERRRQGTRRPYRAPEQCPCRAAIRTGELRGHS